MGIARWDGVDGIAMPYEDEERGIRDTAPVMQVPQDRGIRNLRESMPGWPAARRSIPVRNSCVVASRQLLPGAFEDESSVKDYSRNENTKRSGAIIRS